MKQHTRDEIQQILDSIIKNEKLMELGKRIDMEEIERLNRDKLTHLN